MIALLKRRATSFTHKMCVYKYELMCKSRLKLSVAEEEAACHLINCLMWSHSYNTVGPHYGQYIKHNQRYRCFYSMHEFPFSEPLTFHLTIYQITCSFLCSHKGLFTAFSNVH